MDSDDEWHEDKLALHVEYHKQNPNILMSYTDEKWMRDGAEVKIPKKFKKIGKDVFSENLEYCNIAPSSVLVSKKILNQVQNDRAEVFDESLEVCEDYDLWLRITCRYKVGLIDEKLIVKYAGHDDQLSFKHWGMDRFRVVALEKLLCSYGEGKPSRPREVTSEDRILFPKKEPSACPRPKLVQKPKASHRVRNGTECLPSANYCVNAEGKPSRPIEVVSEGRFEFSETAVFPSEEINGTAGLPPANTNKKQLLKNELIKKYKLLLKGAIKYDKITDKQNYEDKLKLYE